MTSLPLPRIIQGGMGVGVSSWRLANAVARTGNLGVVSGSMLDTVLVRRLQDGDPGGHGQRAMAHFPIPGVADEVLQRWFRSGGRAPGAPYALLPMYRQRVSDAGSASRWSPISSRCGSPKRATQDVSASIC